jgi:protein-tyrosine kinase
MTILEALAKAKRHRDEKARDGARESGAGEASVVRRHRAEGSPIAVAVTPLEFERLDADPQVCEQNRVLITRHRKHTYSTVLDSYRILRTRLLHRIGSQHWTSLGIVSAGPGEGKSLTAINLAVTMAREKKRNVFLLDLDLRNPSLCRYLGVTPRVDIGRYLTGEAKPEEIFFSIGVDNLVLAGGLTTYENSSELLGGNRLGELLAYINSIDPHALVLVDLPPLLVTADSMVVAPKLSAVLFVVAEGLTRRDQLKRATEVLAGVTVAGIVLNRSRESVEDYYS